MPYKERITCGECRYWEEFPPDDQPPPEENKPDEEAPEEAVIPDAEEGIVLDMPGEEQVMPRHPLANPLWGTCHRRCPAPQCMCQKRSDGTEDWPWPITPDVEWCGEAEPKED